MALFAASKAEVEIRRLGVWRRVGGVALEGLLWLWCGIVTLCVCSIGVGMLRGKDLASVFAGGMTMAFLDVVFCGKTT